MGQALASSFPPWFDSAGPAWLPALSSGCDAFIFISFHLVWFGLVWFGLVWFGDSLAEEEHWTHVPLNPSAERVAPRRLALALLPLRPPVKGELQPWHANTHACTPSLQHPLQSMEAAAAAAEEAVPWPCEWPHVSASAFCPR